MKFVGYVLRNAMRNPIRSVLTVASISVSLFLMMILGSFLTINDDVLANVRIYNRVIAMAKQGLGQPLPIARLDEIRKVEGVSYVSPFSWYGGKLGDDPVPFAQFGSDPETIFTIYDDLALPPAQVKAFQDDRTGCVIGVKLAQDQNWKLGDRVLLKGDLYPVDLELTVRGIYDGTAKSDRRMLFFNWSYLEEKLKSSEQTRNFAGNAGVFVIKCDSAESMASVGRKIDELYANSDAPTRTQTEEQFGKMFQEYFGNLLDMIQWVGFAVVVSLLLVAANAMAIAMRERTTEIAVLKAIGFERGLVITLVLAEAMLIASIGGVVGAFGSKLLFDYFDVSRFTSGFLPFFYVPLPIALMGFGLSILIGFVSGVFPALAAARLSVINGLRKVV